MNRMRHRERPQIGAGADAFIALFGIVNPSPEQYAGALLLAAALVDLHTLTKDS
jgi:hypothetical protein